MRRAFFALFVAIALLCSASLGADQTKPAAYVVIVHPKNGASVLERKFVEDAFLKKVSSWPGGELIKPADLASDSAVRRVFTDQVLRKSVEEVRRFWQQRIFSGRDVPPPEFSSDAEVVKYVIGHEGGMGYVSGTADVSGAKVVTVR